MKRLMYPCLLIAWATAFAQPPTPPPGPTPEPPKVEPIRLPNVVGPPTPTPVPTPTPPGTSKLSSDVQYVIDADVEAFVIASPPGMVTVTKEAGPMRVRGKFIDSGGKTVTRKFEGKFLYFIAPVDDKAYGGCEVIVGPIGLKSESDIKRQMVMVDSGLAPQPPPVPPPGPPGPPAPPAPVPADKLRVLIVGESADMSKLPRAQQVMLNAGAVRSYLNSHCDKEANGWPAWRIWDKDADASNESKVWQDTFARAKGKPTPWVIISNGKEMFEGPLPTTTVEDWMALLKKYGGG
jgi:hypothetical protein